MGMLSRKMTSHALGNSEADERGLDIEMDLCLSDSSKELGRLSFSLVMK
jgi:hypothetical protein